MTSKRLIEEIVTRPVDERIAVAESVLKSLNAPYADSDSAWVKIAERRRHDQHEGRIESVPLEAVKESVARRFSS
ncbi:MAG: addiction module protein [Spirochaetaceae bacterium]|nr:MAG: addiction module protein [Spirochaetaceae bacterium]